MRKTLIAVAATAIAAGIAVPTVSTATVADGTCYTLGLSGQNHYEYCTQLPVDPNDIIR